jgi:tyrosine-protein kinase Etk/Wzc
MIEPIMANGERGEGADAKTQVDALYKRITSWTKLLGLIDQFRFGGARPSSAKLEGIAADLKKSIVVSMKDRDIVDIAFQDTDPVLAQKVANSIAQEFINESAKTKKEQARNAMNFINEQLNIYRQKLGSSEKMFSVNKVDDELRMALDRKQLLESRLASLRTVLPGRVTAGQNPAVSRLQTQLAELEMELAKLMVDAREEHPRVISLRKDIARVKDVLDIEIKKDTVHDGIASSDPVYLQAEQELHQVNLQISYLQKRKNELRGEDDQDGSPAEAPGALATGQKVDEDIYRMLLKQAESISVADRLQDTDKGSAFSIVEYARLPLSPVKPNRIAIIFGGLCMGMLAGLGSVFLMEYLDRSFRTSDDAKKVLKMQFLGSISKIILERNDRASAWNMMNNNFKMYLQKKRLFSGFRFVTPHIARTVMSTGISPQVVIHHEPKCAVAEEFRILRTNVHGLNYESVMKTILIASTVRGEGKSTTGTNLAISIADTGKKTMLIDCDLRRGTVHELLNLPQTPGLSDVLNRGVSPDTAITNTRISNLTVLPCGSRPANPSELLGSKKMEHLLDMLKSRFDMIIMDAPPILNLPDTCIAAKYADGIIFVVQAERTQREDIVRAQSMLLQAHGNIAGFVLTNVQYHIPKYVYDYLYGT